MGDRAVFGFESDGETIYLYAHWGAEEFLELLQEAISAARPVWNDNHYATRVAISSIIRDAWSDVYGFGLSVNSYTAPDQAFVLLVDWGQETVTLQGSNWARYYCEKYGKECPSRTFTFDEVLELTQNSYDLLSAAAAVEPPCDTCGFGTTNFCDVCQFIVELRGYAPGREYADPEAASVAS